MSSPLAERIRTDMVAAMKAKDKDRVSVLRMLMAAIKQEAIDNRENPDDEQITRLLMSYAKKREETMVEVRKLGRDDLAAKEEAELVVVRAYLPEPLDDEALVAMVDGIIAELGASSMKDMGKVMKACLDKASGRADGTRISPLVKSRLSG